MAAHPFDSELRDRAALHLGHFARRSSAVDGRRPAAVAVVLVPDDEGRACFLLTRRAPTLRAHARKRGWNKLRLLSAAEGSKFKYDLASEDREGNQDSTVSVFTRDPDGTLRHFYSAHPHMACDIRERGIDLLTPVYNVLDLTPQGRSDWYASLDYGTRVNSASKSE